MTEYEKRLEQIVDSLGCSLAEAKAILDDDKKIDKGQAVSFGLSKQEEKEALRSAMAKSVERKKPMSLNLQKRERKADVTKEGVIQAIFEFLSENGYEDVEIINKSKLLSFKIADDTYKLDLIRQRKPKN